VSRRRSYAQRLFRSALRSFVREAKLPIGVLLLAEGLIVAITLLGEPSRFAQGLIIGVSSTVFLGFFVLLFLMVTGSVLTLAGIWGERFAKDELKMAVKRGHIWGFVSNVELGGFDIDSIAVAPGGVFALEVKAHLARRRRRDDSADLQQARYGARKAASIFRSVHVQSPHEVEPVLVLWGRRGADEVPAEGLTVDGVHVVAVGDLANWLRRHRTGRISEDNAKAVLARLQDFKDTRRACQVLCV